MTDTEAALDLEAITPETCRAHAKNTETIWRGQSGWSETANMAIEWRKAADTIERQGAELRRLREGREELHSFFCSEELAMGFEGDTEGWTAEHSAIVLIRRLRALAGGRSEVIEECARIADAHKGQAARDRQKKHPYSIKDPEFCEEIRAEERGETIAAEIIAANIRKLALAPTPPERGRAEDGER